MQVEISFEDKDESLVKNKQDIVSQLNLPLSFSLKDGITSDLLAALRVSMMSDEEVYFFSKSKELSSLIRDPLSPINEYRVLKSLKRRISDHINQDASASSSLEAVLKDVRTRCNAFSGQNQSKMISSSVSDEALGRLMEWAKQHNVVDPSVELKVGVFEGTGRGVFANTPLQQDQVILRLNQKLIINLESALESDLGPLFHEMRESDVHDDTILILFLLYERSKKESSIWEPYFATLPDPIEIGLTLPLIELMKMDHLPLMMEIIDSKEQIRGIYEETMLWLQDREDNHGIEILKSFSFEDFLWARSVFDSRGFSLDFENKGTLKNCLLPFIDMLNTSNYPQLDGRPIKDDTCQEFQIRAFADVSPQSELFINYGPYSNRELLLNYGFVIDNNPYDRYRIGFEMPMDEHIDARLELLNNFGLDFDHFLRKGPLSPKLLASLRVCMTDSEEIEALRANKVSPLTGPVSFENETRVLSTLSTIVDDLAQELSFEEDDQMEEDTEEKQESQKDENEETSESADSIVERYIKCQREILEFTKEYVHKELEQLEKSEENNIKKRKL